MGAEDAAAGDRTDMRHLFQQPGVPHKADYPQVEQGGTEPTARERQAETWVGVRHGSYFPCPSIDPVSAVKAITHVPERLAENSGNQYSDEQKCFVGGSFFPS